MCENLTNEKLKLEEAYSEMGREMKKLREELKLDNEYENELEETIKQLENTLLNKEYDFYEEQKKVEQKMEEISELGR